MVVYSNLTSDDVMVVTLAEGWTWSCDIHEQVKFIHCIKIHSSCIFEYLEVVDIQKRNTFVISCNSSTPSSLRLKNCLKPGAGEWHSTFDYKPPLLFAKICCGGIFISNLSPLDHKLSSLPF